jgi:hypothetical protein
MIGGILMAEEVDVFKRLNKIDVSKKTKQKQNLTYLPWASAWAEVKKIYPDASFRVIPQIMDEHGNTRPWHSDGVSGWVSVGVTIQGTEITEDLAIMDFKNKAIPAENITSVDANKAVKRCLVKALALHGLGTYIYEGEDLPEETTKLMEIKEKIKVLIEKKKKQSADFVVDIGKLCREAVKEYNPDIPDELNSGDWREIEDAEILNKLRQRIMAIRK